MKQFYWVGNCGISNDVQVQEVQVAGIIFFSSPFLEVLNGILSQWLLSFGNWRPTKLNKI